MKWIALLICVLVAVCSVGFMVLAAADPEGRGGPATLAGFILFVLSIAGGASAVAFL